MSFIDKVSNILRMDYNQDDYDDYDEDFDDDFDEDEEETRQPERVSRTSYRDNTKMKTMNLHIANVQATLNLHPEVHL